MLYHLAANKSVQDRLRKEVNDNLSKDGRIDIDVLNNMEYMDAVFHGWTIKMFVQSKHSLFLIQ